MTGCPAWEKKDGGEGGKEEHGDSRRSSIELHKLAHSTVVVVMVTAAYLFELLKWETDRSAYGSCSSA
jgi:hypothetical protein